MAALGVVTWSVITVELSGAAACIVFVEVASVASERGETREEWSP